MTESNGHPDLAARVLGRLEAGESLELDRHLASCEACRAELSELEETAAFLAIAAPASTFHPDRQGRSGARFTAAVDPARFPVLSVTAEPGDGDPRPTGPEVLRSGT